MASAAEMIDRRLSKSKLSLSVRLSVVNVDWSEGQHAQHNWSSSSSSSSSSPMRLIGGERSLVYAISTNDMPCSLCQPSKVDYCLSLFWLMMMSIIIVSVQISLQQFFVFFFDRIGCSWRGRVTVFCLSLVRLGRGKEKKKKKRKTIAQHIPFIVSSARSLSRIGIGFFFSPRLCCVGSSDCLIVSRPFFSSAVVDPLINWNWFITIPFRIQSNEE